MPAPTDRGASPFGYHFLNTYQQCPRKWYIQNVLHLRPKYEKPPLLFGKAWHTLLELLLGGNTLAFSTASAFAAHTAMRSQYESEDKFNESSNKLASGLPGWLDATASELGLAAPTPDDPLKGPPEILAVEDDFTVPIAGGLQFSVRTDGRLRMPDGRTYILEHKTTAGPALNMLESVDCEDQMTGYLLAYKRRFPDQPIDGVLLDITSWKTAIPKTTYAVITRSQEELVNFEISLVGLFTELRQKQLALEAGANPFELFPRNGAWCGLFGCQFSDICRNRLEMGPIPPTDAFTVEIPDETK